MSERGRVRYPAVCSCFLPLIVHFIIAQAADLVLAQTAGAGSPDIAAGVSVLTSAVCIPLFALWLRSEGKFREEKAAGADRTAWICLAFVCGAALSLLWGGCSTFFRLSDFFSDNAQERLFSASLPLQILGPGLLAPVCEELLFRGLMFRIWTREFGRRSGILIVSLAFALYHGNPLQFLYAFPMGLVMQYFLEKGGSLACPAACHMAANLTSILAESIL